MRAALVDARLGGEIGLLVHGDADRVADPQLVRLRPRARGQYQKECAYNYAFHHVSCLS